MTRTYFTYIYIKFPISLKMYTQLRLDLQGFLSAFIFMYWILFSHFKCTHPYHVWRNRLKQILQSCLGLGLGQFLNLCMAPPCPCRLPPDLAPSCDLGPPTQHRPAWAAGLWATLVTLTRSALLCLRRCGWADCGHCPKGCCSWLTFHCRAACSCCWVCTS